MGKKNHKPNQPKNPEKECKGRSVEHRELWDLFDEEKFFDSSLTLFAIAFHSAILGLISATSWETKAISMNYHSKCSCIGYNHKIQKAWIFRNQLITHLMILKLMSWLLSS